MNIFKTVLKNLIPPFLFKIIKKVFKIKKKYTFISKFKSIKEMERNHKYILEYIDDDLEKKKSQTFLKPKFIHFENKYSCVPILVSLLKDNISILEYGGGDNPVYSYIKNTTVKNIYSVVIEKKSFVKKFSNKVPDEFKEEISYIDDVDNVSENKFDIIFFGSSIQYSKDHEKLLSKMFSFDSKYIIISRTFFNFLDDDFFVIQNNIPNNTFPYKMINFENFVKFMERNSYNLIFNATLKSEHKHENITEISYKDLIFKKNIEL